jgi:hypothetical protein
MRRYRFGWVALGLISLQAGVARAQSSIDILEEELKTAKQERQDMTEQAKANFFSQIDAAMGSPDAAVALYQQAGGSMPAPSPVVTQHETESVSEREARLALDQAAITQLGTLLQLHCGLMHYAALFVVDPKKEGLQQDWVAWLQKAAQTYVQLGQLPDSSGGGAGQPAEPVHHHHHEEADGGQNAAPPAPPPPPLSLPDLKARTMHDSIISKFLAFRSWGDGEQGGWAVKDLPKLYRANVLDPSRTPPTEGTLAAWDLYIAMLNADEKDNDRWNNVVNPPLQFDRACDDYTIAPSTEKLEGLINLVKANPTHPDADDWISRIHQLMEDYRAHHGGSSDVAQTPAAPTPVAKDSNVTVSTQQQGDATIVTTHTNSAPVSPPPPAH